MAPAGCCWEMLKSIFSFACYSICLGQGLQGISIRSRIVSQVQVTFLLRFAPTIFELCYKKVFNVGSFKENSTVRVENYPGLLVFCSIIWIWNQFGNILSEKKNICNRTLINIAYFAPSYNNVFFSADWKQILSI